MQDASHAISGQRALVTGGTGFIGRHLVGHLRAAGWNVHLLVRPGTAEASEGIHLYPYSGETREVIAAVQSSAPDVVFHLASLFAAQHDPDQIRPMIAANVLLGTQLLEAMSRTGTRSLINTGTSWQHFQFPGYRPVNLYAATKQAFEDILAYYADSHGIRSITLALFDSYGPGDTRRKLLRTLLDALTSREALLMSPGDQIIDLAHVDDICAAFLHAANLVRDPGHPPSACYAVSGGQRMTLRNLVDTLQQAAGTSLSIQWGARPHRDREVMLPWDGPSLPDWTARISLADGFRSLIQENSAGANPESRP